MIYTKFYEKLMMNEDFEKIEMGAGGWGGVHIFKIKDFESSLI